LVINHVLQAHDVFVFDFDVLFDRQKGVKRFQRRLTAANSRRHRGAKTLVLVLAKNFEAQVVINQHSRNLRRLSRARVRCDDLQPRKKKARKNFYLINYSIHEVVLVFFFIQIPVISEKIRVKIRHEIRLREIVLRLFVLRNHLIRETKYKIQFQVHLFNCREILLGLRRFEIAVKPLQKFNSEVTRIQEKKSDNLIHGRVKQLIFFVKINVLQVLLPNHLDRRRVILKINVLQGKVLVVQVIFFNELFKTFFDRESYRKSVTKIRKQPALHE
jgi:hypothetical protein